MIEEQATIILGKCKRGESMPGKEPFKFQVFISHSSIDTWVARQIANHIKSCGASTFLDEADIEYGDDIEEKILDAAQASNELLVLLTPWATKRPYIWMEIGAFWGQSKRIVGILHGLTVNQLVSQEGTPTLLKRIDLVDINTLEVYFQQLQNRIENMRRRK
ncbi:MAG: toll/interleukin-1 receptor domain-containing protein [Calditrichaceae bacterium]|nr:toll/interleukin-1 receptor domain-containing protein [Calditrichia bacterium]NUQ40104.1 toll/interleukin-1 receptor domain-containing protein [Calditrichaceae bacterium]